MGGSIRKRKKVWRCCVYRRIFLMDFVCSYFFFIHWIFFDSVQKIFAFNFNFLFKFSSFIFVLMPRIDLLCCCGDQFFYLFFKISCWKKTSSFPFYYFFYIKNTQKFVKWGGWKIMPQENIMANARLQTRKKNSPTQWQNYIQ